MLLNMFFCFEAKILEKGKMQRSNNMSEDDMQTFKVRRDNDWTILFYWISKTRSLSK